MKYSHERTPRMLGDCSFIPSADPIERFVVPDSKGQGIVIAVLVALAIAAVVVLALDTVVLMP